MVHFGLVGHVLILAGRTILISYGHLKSQKEQNNKGYQLIPEIKIPKKQKVKVRKAPLVCSFKMEKVKIRTVIEYLFKKGLSEQEIHL